MAFASVTVSRPRNRTIYLNGDYLNPAGDSSTATFVVPAGNNTAETLNDRREVDFRSQFEVRPTDTSVTIELAPVVPPEKI